MNFTSWHLGHTPVSLTDIIIVKNPQPPTADTFIEIETNIQSLEANWEDLASNWEDIIEAPP